MAEAWATACSAAPRTAATGFLLRPRLVVACVAEAASVVNGIGNTPFHGRCISDSAHALGLASVRVQIRECVGLATSRTENDAGSAVVEQDKTHLALHMVCRGSSLALAHLDEDADDALRHTQLDRHSQLDPIEIEKAPRRCR